MLRETSAVPSCTLCDDVSLCLGTIIVVNSVDLRRVLHYDTIWLSSHAYITHSHVRFHGNTKEGDKPQRSVPKSTIWLRTDMSHMRTLTGDDKGVKFFAIYGVPILQCTSENVRIRAHAYRVKHIDGLQIDVRACELA